MSILVRNCETFLEMDFRQVHILANLHANKDLILLFYRIHQEVMLWGLTFLQVKSQPVAVILVMVFFILIWVVVGPRALVQINGIWRPMIQRIIVASSMASVHLKYFYQMEHLQMFML